MSDAAMPPRDFAIVVQTATVTVVIVTVTVEIAAAVVGATSAKKNPAGHMPAGFLYAWGQGSLC